MHGVTLRSLWVGSELHLQDERVVEIVDRVPPSNWYHVSSGDNPADVASRGTTANSLISMDLWWYGPDWLCSTPDKWHLQDRHDCIKLPELKSSALVIKTPPGNREPIISKFSSYSILINVCSWIGLFAANVT